MQFRRGPGAWLASAGAIALVACPGIAAAQSAPVVSREVVQRLPSANSKQLSTALARISRDPRDFSALIDAGDAANAMGDAEAAVGFYRRADAISANNPRIKAGLARALVLQGNPTEAIPLFAQAEAGGSAADVTTDRGLAYDLVGDTTTAQRYYRTALARKDDDELRRRLGISLAIAGEAEASEAMLMPLLRKQDKPGWRSHAFALAIAGKTKEAVDTVNAILPGTLAQSITPYLRYMPRLTRAQQAAAANLGKFPRASEIGRDDPAIAAYAPSATRVASADAGLIPQGKPLGGGRSRPATRAAASETPPLTRSQRLAKDRAARLARAEADAAARVAPPDPAPAIGRETSGELPPVGARVALSSSTTPLPTPASPGARPIASQIAANQGPAPRPAPTSPTASPAPAAQPLPQAPARTASLTLPTFEPPAQAVAGAAPGFDLARLPASATVAATPAQPAATVQAAVVASPNAAEAPPSPVSLEQAFADLGAPSRAAAPISGAVDIRAIEPAKPQPDPEPVKLAAAAPAPSETASERKKPTEPTGKEAAGKEATAKAAEAKKLADSKKAAETKKAAESKKVADAKKLAAKKAPPSHPSRIWVQIGVGRDKGAIAYDWRKFAKEHPAPFKGREAYVSDMGRTNRILAGPFETQKAANAFVTQLKKANFERGFVWTSPAGQVVDPLK